MCARTGAKQASHGAWSSKLASKSARSTDTASSRCLQSFNAICISLPRKCALERGMQLNVEICLFWCPGHMHPPFFKIMNEIQEGLQYVFQTSSKYTLLISGTGHAGMLQPALACVISCELQYLGKYP